MVSHARIAKLQFLVAAALAVSLATGGAAIAKGSSRTGSRPGAATVTCNGQTVSAVDEYCEQIPGAAGGGGTGPGTPQLASTLPAKLVARLAANPALRPLLRIPAPAHSRPIAPPASFAGGQPTSTSSPWRWIVIALVALALVIAALDVARRRRRRAPGGAS
jgi:hypothetical protein